MKADIAGSRGLESFLDDLENRLWGCLGEGDRGELEFAAAHICFAPKAKRARPRLVYMFGEALGVEEGWLLDVAVAVELMHTASLLHDDVVDDGHLRRGMPTVNAKWGNLVAVLTGDLMLSKALLQLERHPASLAMEGVKVVLEMTRAAILEARARSDVELGVAQWREIARGKTGVLFGWCGWAVGTLAGNREAADRFARCGHHLGLAFQMADDLKDLQSHTAGKDRFADIKNRNPSFPLLVALERSSEFKERLRGAWQQSVLEQEEIAALGQLVLGTGAAETTYAQTGHEIEEAIEALGSYAQAPGCRDIVAWVRMFWQGLSASTLPAVAAKAAPYA